MKKIFYVLISVFIFSTLSAQSNFPQEFRKHLSILQTQNNLSGTGNYITNLNLAFWAPSELTSRMWIDGGWMNMAYTQFFYDNGLLVSEINMGWQNETWVNNSRTTYTYENNLQNTAQTEDWENESWVLTMQSIWVYNENEDVTTILDQNMVNNEWINLMRTTYTYEGENCIELVMETWENDAWSLQHKTTYEYDGEGNRTVSFSESWFSGMLINTSKTIYTFENGLRTQELQQTLMGTEWVDVSKSTYSYNDNGQQTQYISENWNGSEWVYNMNGQYTYDENGNNTEILTMHWLNNNWENFMKLTFIYQEMTSVLKNETAVTDFKLYNNYPNPFNPSTNFRFRIPVTGIATLKIFDPLGNEVAVLLNNEINAGEYELKWNPVNLSSGVYYFQLTTTNLSETKKLLLMK